MYLNMALSSRVLQKPLREQTLYGSFLVIIITLVLIDGTESLATIQAIDKIDPFKRKSNPNVTLRAMGFSNTASSLLGGLTIIPGGLKSTVNMLAGGLHPLGQLLLCDLSVDHPIVRRSPHELCAQIGPGGAAHVDRLETLLAQSLQADLLGRQGADFIAVVNLVVTLWTSDLLEGMIAGVATKIVLLVKDVVRASPGEGIGAALKELFRDPVIRIGDSGAGSRSVMTVSATAVLRGTVGEMKNPYKIYLSSATCMNLVKLDAALKKIVVPEGMKANYMLILAGKVVDHTTMEYLHNFQDRVIEGGHTCVLVGMEHFRGLSDHALAYRVSQTPGNLTAFA